MTANPQPFQPHLISCHYKTVHGFITIVVVFVQMALIIGTLYIFSGPEDPGPGDPNWHTLYVYIHSTYIVHTQYIYNTRVSNRSTGMHYGTD